MRKRKKLNTLTLCFPYKPHYTPTQLFALEEIFFENIDISEHNIISVEFTKVPGYSSTEGRKT